MKPRHIAALFAALVALFATGCRENTIINTNITPAGDSISTEGESVAISARTVYSHFITSQYVAGAILVKGLGHIANDPEIGSTNISLYMQIVPKQSAGYLLPDTAKIDSVVLVLPYFGFTYGDTTAASASAQTYTAYEVTDSMASTTTYYDYSQKSFNSTPLGQTTLSFAALKDSVFAEGQKQAPHLRIKMNGLKGRLKDGAYTSYADFLNSFKGIYIKAEDLSGRNNIPYFRLTDNGIGDNYSKAGVIVYYRDDADSAKTDAFPFNPDNCAQFNRVVNNYSGLDTANYVYFQSRPGLSVEINTLDVKNLPLRLVNKAELVITEVPSNIGNQKKDLYFASEYLYPYLGGSDTTLTFIADATFTSPSGTQTSGLSFISGIAKKVTVNGESVNQYTVNLPREFQKALKEGKEMSVRLTGVTNGYYTGAFRLKAFKNSNTNPAFNIRLNVVYSSIQ